MATDKSYHELRTEIKQLEQAAEKARKREKPQALKQIHALMNQHGITLDDIRGLDTVPRKRGRKPGKVKRGTGVVKFRHPDGREWTGHGRAPMWYLEAVKEGKVDSLRVDGVAVKPTMLRSAVKPAVKLAAVPVTTSKAKNGVVAKSAPKAAVKKAGKAPAKAAAKKAPSKKPSVRPLVKKVPAAPVASPPPGTNA